MSSRGGYAGWQMLLILMVAGALIVGWMGEALVMFIPALSGIGKSYTVGITPFDINLRIITITFGLMLKLNLFSLLGLVGGFFVYRKM
ncbi:MAG: DUF4321 domain-containing protein [Ignavibacteriales bacterium]